MPRPVFLTNFFEQKRSLESLLKESRADQSFYILLSLSTFITTLGFLVNSDIVIVSGMFVAPLLFPILSLGMGISTSSTDAIVRAVRTILKSIITVLIVSFVTAFLIHPQAITDQMHFVSNPDLLFFLIAFASGIVSSYAWVKEKISSSLPGIAMAVSLLPPLALAGIALAIPSRALFTGSFMLFIINILGIVVASTIIFSLFGFSVLQKLEEEKIHEEKIVDKIQKTARKEAKERDEFALKGEHNSPNNPPYAS
jgi:uncharacterized hydrophobic protein (TIGR00271 family)